MRKLCLLLILCAAACSGGGGGGGGGAGGTGGGGGQAGAGGGGGAGGAGVLSFRTMPYTLPAGGEDYRCTWFQPQVPAQAAIKVMHPVEGPGVHHTALFFATGDSLQSERSCRDFGTNWILVAGAGVGSGDVLFPQGVALPVRAGGAYVLQIHMLNATTGPLDVTAGYDLILTQPGESYSRAGVYLSVNTSLNIPAGAVGYAAEATCSGNIPGGSSFVSLFPHMHKLGRRFVIDHVVADVATTVYDKTWNFDAQSVDALDPALAMAASDQIRMRCVYDNPGTQPVHFGLSTSDEMCAAVFYYHPATTDQVSCLH